jgi:hypothetical protein
MQSKVCSSEMSEDFTHLHGTLSQKTVLFILHVICRPFNGKKWNSGILSKTKLHILWNILKHIKTFGNEHWTTKSKINISVENSKN